MNITISFSNIFAQSSNAAIVIRSGTRWMMFTRGANRVPYITDLESGKRLMVSELPAAHIIRLLTTTARWAELRFYTHEDSGHPPVRMILAPKFCIFTTDDVTLETIKKFYHHTRTTVTRTAEPDAAATT